MKKKEIYDLIWEKAKPYYEKGRPFDIEHIEWMIKDALLICEKESIDDSILLPLVILHDVGYSELDDLKNPYKLETRRAHMKAGAKIAKQILSEIDYPSPKISKIVDYIAIHDNWAFDENERYTNDKILGTFNDLDYMWLATEKGFKSGMKIMNLNQNEMLDYLKNNQKLIKRPFATQTALELYNDYLKAHNL